MTEKQAIIIPRTMAIELLHEAQLSPDAEICGMVGGKAGAATSVYSVSNTAEDRSRAFALEAEGQVEAMRQMRERGEQLLAVYHSHPTSPAEPSPADIEQAGYPEALFLIMSLNTKGVLQMRCWEQAGGEVHERVLKIIEDD